jgi:hypothetical protein
MWSFMIVQRLTTLLLTLLGAYAAASVYPPELPEPRHDPDLFTAIFECRPIVFAARVTALCLAAFVISSIVARIRNREWLSKAGPFEVVPAATEAGRESKDLRERLARADARADELQAMVAALRAPKSVCSTAVPTRGGDDGHD